MLEKNFYQLVYFWVKKIPKGKVATYGQIAALSRSPRSAQIVGWALHKIPRGSKIPWQRVINKEGRISTTCEEHPHLLQKALLEKEGVKVQEKNQQFFIDLKKYLWKPYLKP